MKKLLTILFFLPLLVNGQGILVGYVKSSGSTSSANGSLTNINTPVYSRYRTFSQIAEGDTLYSNVGLTTPLVGGSFWWGYNTANGGNTSYRSYQITNAGKVLFVFNHHTAYTLFLNYGGDCSATNASVNDCQAVSADDDTSMYVGKRTVMWNGANFGVGTAAAVLKAQFNSVTYWTVVFGSNSKVASIFTCTLGNQVPVSNAGADQVLSLPTNTTTLDGSASYDPDGTISTYKWTRLNNNTAPILKTLDLETNPNTQIGTWAQILYSGFPGYSLVVDSTIKRSGVASARFTTLKSENPVTTANYHATLNLSPESNADRWYGFSEYLPSPYTLDPESEGHVQWHHVQDVGDSVAAPPIAMLVQNDSIILNVLYSSAPLQTNANTTLIQYFLGMVQRNVWTDWVFHIKFSYTGTGVLEVWKNGVKVVTRNGANCYNDASLPYWVIGIYKFSWAVIGNVSTVTQRTVYYDEVRQGDQTSVYRDVEPASGIVSTDSAVTGIRGLDFGQYTYELAVTDNVSTIRRDSVDITVYPQAGTTVDGKVIMNYKWSWQNNSFVGDLKPMFDGNTGTYAFTGYIGLINPCWVVIDIPDSLQLSLEKIRMYGGDWKVVHFNNLGNPIDTVYYPMSVYYNDTLLAHRIGVYNGGGNAWVETSITPVTTHQIWIKKYKMPSNVDALPAELEIIGTYKGWIEPTVGPRRPRKYEDVAAGANNHIWHVIQNSRFGWNDVPYEPKLDILTRLTNHTRVYVDANYLNPTQNTYTFNPTPNGNYNLDTLFWVLKQRGISALPCIKTCPEWMTTKSKSENVPNWPEDPTYANFLSPTAYIDYGKLMWQFAKRYGHDTTKFNKIKVDPNYRAYTSGPLNVARAGLGWLDEVELENERDKSWKGRSAFQTGFEYAAMLSACWDGHMGTLGDTVGVHNADPTMRLVIAGTAQADQDFFRGICEWWRKVRGEELPALIVFNFHDYSNDAEQYSSTRGVPPETGHVVENIQELSYAAKRWSGDSTRLVYQTEYSQGTHKNSGQGVHSIGTHTLEEVAGWWTCRQSLLNWVYGVDKAFPYELFDDQPYTFGTYAMSGKTVDEMHIKTVFEYEVQQRRNLSIADTPVLISTNPYVIRARKNNKYIYAAWMGTEKDSIATYTLTKLTGENFVKIYKLAKGKLVSDVSSQAFSGSTAVITVGEAPIYFEAVTATQSFTTPVANAGVDQTISLPTSEVTLNSAGSTTGTGVETYWQYVSGPLGSYVWSPLESQTQASNLFAGVYKFTLKVWNSDGIMSVDTVQITVNPIPGNPTPAANAGPDLTMTTASDFTQPTTASAADNGSVTQIWWDKISGPIDWNTRFPNSLSPRIDNLLPGIYQFKMMAVDNQGSVGYDTLKVTVTSPSGNPPPTVNAGFDASTTLTSYQLTGTANSSNGGSIVSTAWTVVSGTATLSNPTSLTTSATGLVPGVYTFRLTATDTFSQTTSDDVVVTVVAVGGTIRIYRKINVK